MRSVSIWMAISLLICMAGPGCRRDSSQNSSSQADWHQWSQIDLKEYFTIQGAVDADEDISGIACISEKYGLLGVDEGRNVYFIEISRQTKTLQILDDVELLNSGDEIDIEAIAAEGDGYYITGSHGLSKKGANKQSNRYKIFRLRVSLETGMPIEHAKGSVKPNADFLTVSTLVGILSKDPQLGRYFQMPLQRKGVNIEGLAVKNGRLYAGLRSPNVDGQAFVLELATDDLFADQTPLDYELHRLSIGKGLGIRELVRAEDCFLILAGNAGSEPSDEHPQSLDYEQGRDFELFGWDGRGSEVHRIGRIPATGKAEAMTVLSQNQEGVEVLILFDGPKNGRPTVYRVR